MLLPSEPSASLENFSVDQICQIGVRCHGTIFKNLKAIVSHGHSTWQKVKSGEASRHALSGGYPGSGARVRFAVRASRSCQEKEGQDDVQSAEVLW